MIQIANFLDELNKPYVVTARAKGMSEWALVLKYPVRLAINPLVSTIGWYLPQLFSGSLIVAGFDSLDAAQRWADADPYVAAGHAQLDDVIDPADTRMMLVAGLDMLRSKREDLPKRKHGNVPL